MSHRRFAVRLVVLFCAAIVLMTRLSGSEKRTIVVTNTAELMAALSGGAGETIFLQPGTYQLSQAIQVPDNTALIGEGTMLYDNSGLPTGFAPEGLTVIAAISGVSGHFVTLGDGASLRGFVIQDVVRPAITGGGVVAVTSRHPGDSVSAQVRECEIINPNPLGNALDGPSGRGLSASTRNPHFSTGAVPHEQSRVSVHLTQSIIRSPAGGGGVFFANHASGSQIELHLQQNVMGGGFGGAAASSRPDSVIGSTVLVQSLGNLYRSDTATPTSLAWNLQGGADGPAFGGTPGETLNNRLWVHSVDDHIQGFGQLILASAGRRNSALSAAVSSNELDLILQGTLLESITTDLLFRGASSAVASMAVGDGNELRVTMRHVTGSGPRTNDYINSTANLGIGNRLIITGNLTAFSQTNEAILPMPGEQFFTAGR